jgi:hypothetical protein
MSDDLATIGRVIDEHHRIGGHVKLVGDSVTDLEALTNLEKARTDWIPGRIEVLSEKHDRLRKAMSYLEEGLKNHFAFEEEVLPPLLGEKLMQQLLRQHREIGEAIDGARSMIAAARLEGLGREKLLLEELRIQQRVAAILALIEEHAAREEKMLSSIKAALERKG